MPALSLAISSREARVGANEFSSAAKQASNSARELDRSVQGADESFSKAGGSAEVLKGKVAGLLSLYAVQKLIRGSVDEMARWEKGIRNVSTMLNEATMGYIPAYEEGITQLQLKFGESSEALSKGLYDILSASVDASMALNVLEVATRTARAGLTSTAVSADIITTVLNSYGMAATEAEHVSDLLFATVLRGKTTFEQLATTVGQVSSLASSAGLSFEEVSAALATMTRAGLQTDIAVTALKGILTTFLSPTEQNIEASRRLGVELNSNTLKTMGLTGVIRELTGASAENVAGMFSNVRALTGVAALMKQTEGHAFDLKVAMESAGMMNEAFGKISGSTSGRINKMSESIKVLKRELGEGFAPAIENIGESVTKVTPYVRRFIDSFSKGLTEGGPTLLYDMESIWKRMALGWHEALAAFGKWENGISYQYHTRMIRELSREIENVGIALDSWIIPEEFLDAGGIEVTKEQIAGLNKELSKGLSVVNSFGEAVNSVGNVEVNPPSAEFTEALSEITERIKDVNDEVANFGLRDWEKQIISLKAAAEKNLKGEELSSYMEKLYELGNKLQELESIKNSQSESKKSEEEAEKVAHTVKNIADEIEMLKTERELIGKSNEEREKTLAILQAQRDLREADGNQQLIDAINLRKQEAIQLAEVRAAHSELLEQKHKEEELERRLREARENADDMIRELELERELIFVTNEERERAIRLRKLESATKIMDPEEAEEYRKKYNDSLKALEDMRRLEPYVREVTEGIGDLAMAPFDAILDGTKSVSEAIEDELKNIGKNILRTIYQQQVVNPLQNAATGAMTSILGFSKGSAFLNGRVIPFADGTVVNEPTLFPMSSGDTGLMGEGGPEGVLPLKRDSQGRLGVSAQQSAPQVNVSTPIKIINGFDSKSLVGGFLETDEGEKIIVNIIQRNK